MRPPAPLHVLEQPEKLVVRRLVTRALVGFIRLTPPVAPPSLVPVPPVAPEGRMVGAERGSL